MNDTEHRLTKVETLLERISANELPHIQEAVDRNSEKSDKILWWIIGGFSSLFLALLVHAAVTFMQIR